MDLAALGKLLSDTLPSLKGRIQLSGLIIIIVVGSLVTLVRPGDHLAIALVGGVGVGFIVFGQLFHFLTSFSEASRPTVFLASFLCFLLFVVAIVSLFVVHVQPSPSFAINQARAEENEVGKVLLFAPEQSAEEVTYTYSEPNSIPTLAANFPYISWSRADKYPNGDFHQGVRWGHPWMAFHLSNPTKNSIVYSSMQVDLIEMHPIREVILDISEIDQYVSGQENKLVINNRGWGSARNATLRILVGSERSKNSYYIVSSKSYNIGLIDEEVAVDIRDLVPPDAKWDSYKNGSTGQCKEEGYLTAFGRLDYIDDNGNVGHETFRNTIFQCMSGGGNIPWSAQFNVHLPDDPNKFPILVSLSECVAAQSAAKFRVMYGSDKSGHYRLKFTLKDTEGTTLTREAALDIFVPRPVERAMPASDKFIMNPDVKGCT